MDPVLGRPVEEGQQRPLILAYTLHGFWIAHLIGFGEQIDGDLVRFEMASAAAPTVVRDPADAGALYVLMPMRV